MGDIFGCLGILRTCCLMNDHDIPWLSCSSKVVRAKSADPVLGGLHPVSGMLQLEEVQRRVVEEQDRNKHRQTRRDASFGSNVFVFPFFPGARGGVWQDQCSICISRFGIIWVFGFEVCLGLFREIYHIHVFQTEVGHFICSHPSSKSKFTRASELRTSLGLSKKSTKSSFGFSGRKVRQRLQLLLLTLPIISTATIDPNVSTYCVHDKITVSLGVPQNLRHYPRRSVQ